MATDEWYAELFKPGYDYKKRIISLCSVEIAYNSVIPLPCAQNGGESEPSQDGHAFTGGEE